MAIELRKHGTQYQGRSAGAGDAVGGVVIQVADPDPHRKPVIKSDRPGIPVITGGAGLDRGLDRKPQQAAVAELQPAGFRVRQDVADQRSGFG